MIGDQCTAEWLHDRLQPATSSSSSTSGLLDDVTDGVLVLDCRSIDEYVACHVTGSMPVTVPPIVLRRLRNGSAAVSSVIGGGDALRTAFIERWKSDWIVLYDGQQQQQQSLVPLHGGTPPPATILSTVMSRLKADGCRVCFLQGGFSTFRDKFVHMCIAGSHQHYHAQHHQQQQLGSSPHLRLADDFSNMRLSSSAPSSFSSLNLFIALSSSSDADSSCNGHAAATPTTPAAIPSGGGGFLTPFPVEVVRYLYLGDSETSRDRDCLRRHDIRYVLNVTEDLPNSFDDDPTLTYMRIPITDHWSQSLTSFFADAIVFIDGARQTETSVLVHCLAGISRSVTVTVAYLMYVMSLSLDDAFDYLRRIRSNIAPNFSFMGQLLDYEKTLADARSRRHCVNVPRAPCQNCLRYVTNGAFVTSSNEPTGDVVTPNVIVT